MAHTLELKNTIKPIITVEEIEVLLQTAKPTPVQQPKYTRARQCAHARCQLTKGIDSQDPLKQMFIDIVFVEFVEGNKRCAESIDRVAKLLHYIINEM